VIRLPEVNGTEAVVAPESGTGSYATGDGFCVVKKTVYLNRTDRTNKEEERAPLVMESGNESPLR
jgi:hypothetical protein